MSKANLTPQQTIALLKAVMAIVQDWQREENIKFESETMPILPTVSKERLKKWQEFMKQY